MNESLLRTPDQDKASMAYRLIAFFLRRPPWSVTAEHADTDRHRHVNEEQSLNVSKTPLPTLPGGTKIPSILS